MGAKYGSAPGPTCAGSHTVRVRTTFFAVLLATAAHARGTHFTIYEARDAGAAEHTAFQVLPNNCGKLNDAKVTACRTSARGTHVFVFEGRVIRGMKDGRVSWELPAPGTLAFHTVGLMVFDTASGRRAIWLDVETGTVTRTLDLTKAPAVLPTPSWCGDRVRASYTSSLPGVTAAECFVLD